MEHHLDEGMKEVLVYLELTLISHHHVDREKVLRGSSGSGGKPFPPSTRD